MITMRKLQAVMALATALALTNCGGGGGGGPGTNDTGQPSFGKDSLLTITIRDGKVVGIAKADASTIALRTPEPNQITFRLIEAGSNVVGSEAGSFGYTAFDEARSRQTVGSYYLSISEITQAQWQFIVADGTNPWAEAPEGTLGTAANVVGGDHPAFGLSYAKVDRGLRDFNRQNSAYWLRVPTNVEWEYACRAGATSTFAWGGYSEGGGEGDDLNPNTVANYAVVAETRAQVRGARPAWQKLADGSARLMRQLNRFGVLDLHGNLWEWVGDGEQVDATTGKTLRVLRGGSWADNVVSARCANKQYMAEDVPYGTAGVRLVLVARD